MPSTGFSDVGPVVPPEVFRGLAFVLSAASTVNADLEVIPRETAAAIATAADAMAEQAREGAIPIPAIDARACERAWAMAVEGVSYRSHADLAQVAAGHAAGASFATAALLAAVLGIQKDLLPALYRVEGAAQSKSVRTLDVVDRAAAGLCERARKRLTVTCEELRALPLGDRLPAEPPSDGQWAPRVTAYLSKRFRLQLRSVEGRWASLDAVSDAAAAVRQAADACQRAALVLDRGAQACRLAVAEARGAELTITTLAGSGDGVHGYGRWPLAAAALIGASAAALAGAHAVVSE